ncbi:SLC13 family permease [Pseudooctadecabacter jejudonensis]|uniref:Citrate transporter n=1 Tax=Pseudooctadecabacter jejudonensis TaxID=1391910 RepID=A0A1Y5S345_9RHOB|nr:SLC13 family permease [Pseudooctadecabacter jejudonensis]SLN28644.1 Citrate transporter [Pseudooctadecabacter jejudonensis]
MDGSVLTLEMMVVLGLLAFTVFLFVSEIIRIDLAALLVMALLGILSTVPGLGNLSDGADLFAGFSSNAVISIIAVMIVGAGLDKTGLMSKVAALILKRGGTTEGRIIPIVSGTVGVISSFMQNVGAAALFLPVISRISARTEIPMSRLAMPMGFCAILGGTITMVGSSPLILLNDLLATANDMLPAGQQMEPFGLFSVTPIGIMLVLTGVLYFVLLGRWILPGQRGRGEDAGAARSMQDYIENTYGLRADMFELSVPEGSILIGQTLSDVMVAHHLYILGTSYKGHKVIAPMADTVIEAPCRLAVLGLRRALEDEFCTPYNVKILPALDIFADDFAATESGVAEVVIPPGSSVIGQSPIDLRLRSKHGLSILAIHRGEDTLSHVETEDHVATHIGAVPLQAGDTLVVHVRWEKLTRLKQDRDYVVVTSDFPQEELRPNKVNWALGFFAMTLGLILFTDLLLSLCLLAGALGMILSRVLSIDEAYDAVSWSTVFLLASLIPLGQAVQNTGTAAWIAGQILTLLDGWPLWALQAGLAVLATAFTLVMSNVGATVLLVPLAVSIAFEAGGDPAIFALTVAISTSNSFLIPTHQVNALIMGPAGYRVVDFVRSGGIMTILFLVVSLVGLSIFF